MTPTAMTRTLCFGLTIGVMLLAVPATSWAHAYLVKSSPARRAALSSAPARVMLWFNERLEEQFSELSVWNAAGEQVDGRDVQVGPDDGKKLSVGMPPLPVGTYTVKYRVLSVDGHIVEAEFQFTVRSRQ
jgi:methionine-rich copper-binding protein CopC